MTVEPRVPLLLGRDDLPGPLSRRRLEALGSLTPLDDTCSFWSGHATTLYGRAQVVSRLAPYGTVSCATSAAWVWLGGDLPETVDVLSSSHFRSLAHGRRIRTFARRVRDADLRRIGELRLTDPTRTAVDLALLRPEVADGKGPAIDGLIGELMESYRLSPDACLAVLGTTPHIRNGPAARHLLGMMPDFSAIRRPMRATPPRRRTRAGTRPAGRRGDGRDESAPRSRSPRRGDPS